jgi:hypothetical protein
MCDVGCVKCLTNLERIKKPLNFERLKESRKGPMYI